MKCSKCGKPLGKMKFCNQCGTKRKMGALKITGIVLAMVFGIGLIMPSTPKEEKENTTVEAPQLTEAEQINEIIINSIGQTNRKVERLVKYETEGNTLMLWLNGNDSLTTSWISRGMAMDSAEVYPALFEGLEYDEIIITWLLPYQDQYGNTLDKPVMNFALTRIEADKVNWPEIMTDSFKTLAMVWEKPL